MWDMTVTDTNLDIYIVVFAVKSPNAEPVRPVGGGGGKVAAAVITCRCRRANGHVSTAVDVGHERRLFAPVIQTVLEDAD